MISANNVIQIAVHFIDHVRFKPGQAPILEMVLDRGFMPSLLVGDSLLLPWADALKEFDAPGLPICLRRTEARRRWPDGAASDGLQGRPARGHVALPHRGSGERFAAASSRP